MNIKLLKVAVVSLLCALTAITASAQVKYLIVNYTDGSKTSFALSDNPVITNDSSALTVETSLSSITVPFEQLSDYTFSENQAGAVKEVTVNENHVIRDGEIIFTGLKPNTSVVIFDLSGHEILRSTSDSEGNAYICLYDTVPGVYIVETASSSFKVIKK